MSLPIDLIARRGSGYKNVVSMNSPLFHQKKQSFRFENSFGRSAKSTKERSRRQVSLKEALKSCQGDATSVSESMKMLCVDETWNKPAKKKNKKSAISNKKTFARTVSCQENVAAFLKNQGTIQDVTEALGIAIAYNAETKSFTIVGCNERNLDRAVFRLERAFRIVGPNVGIANKETKKTKKVVALLKTTVTKESRRQKSTTFRIPAAKKHYNATFGKIGGQAIINLTKSNLGVPKSQATVDWSEKSQCIVISARHKVAQKLCDMVEKTIEKST
ncbi:MAG: hypothetical protein SGILL_000380 [Bacillariaceae sp.]